MSIENEPQLLSQEQAMTGVVNEFLNDTPWQDTKINERLGAMREKSVTLPGSRLVYVSQYMFGGEKGTHNLVQVMKFSKEMPLPVSKHIEWHQNGSELQEARIEQPFDVEEVLAEAERRLR